MKDLKRKVLVVIPEALLKKIDVLAKRADKDRSTYICETVSAKMFADECKEAFRET